MCLEPTAAKNEDEDENLPWVAGLALGMGDVAVAEAEALQLGPPMSLPGRRPP